MTEHSGLVMIMMNTPCNRDSPFEAYNPEITANSFSASSYAVEAFEGNVHIWLMG